MSAMTTYMVALLAEGVDRNSKWFESYTGTLTVALLAEGVDRNDKYLTAVIEDAVALLAEGVDRNLTLVAEGTVSIGRPPRGGRG